MKANTIVFDIGSTYTKAVAYHLKKGSLCFLAAGQAPTTLSDVAVGAAQAAQVVAQQGEVLRLLGGDAQPVAVKRLGHAGKAPNGVQRQVDGVEFDVADGVDQGGVPLHGER